MAWENPSNDEVRRLFERTRTIAVVGCSPDESRASHQVAADMQKRGFRIVPVHPAGGTILGETVFADLASIPSDICIDIVDVFRRSEAVVPIANQAIQRKAQAFWLQEGVVNEEAYRLAQQANMLCIMDRCLKVAYRELIG